MRGVEKIRNALSKRGAKVTLLFKEFDSNGDGGISLEEFRDACQNAGVQMPQDQIDACFDSLDREGVHAVSDMLE